VKRYLLFAGDSYYPQGGWDDLQDSFDTSQEAIEAAKIGDSMVVKAGYDWWHIIDSETMTRVVVGMGHEILQADDEDLN
jgi:hypothetical protein